MMKNRMSLGGGYILRPLMTNVFGPGCPAAARTFSHEGVRAAAWSSAAAAL